MKTLGANVWGISRTIPEERIDYLDEHKTMDSLSQVLRSCDYIINVMPSTDATRGLLNGDVLKNCENKKTVFLNIGRGSIVAEADLVNALERKWIGGAILDVFEEEPLPKGSKLWNMPQVIFVQ